jgi:hypothetical protein
MNSETQAWLLAVCGFVVGTVAVLYYMYHKAMKNTIVPRFIVHGGNVKDSNGVWTTVGPRAVANAYGLYQGEWMAANPKVDMETEAEFYGPNVIHLCPLCYGDYPLHLQGVLKMFHQGRHEAIISLFRSHYNNSDFYEPFSRKQARKNRKG